MTSRELQIRHLTLFTTYLLIGWGFYRLLFQLPDPFDEVLAKPVLWLIPVVIFLKKEKLGFETIGITSKKLLPAIYFSLVLGTLFAFEGFFVNYFKYGGSLFMANIGQFDIYTALGISVITAISEEIAFRGYIFNRLWGIMKNEWTANALSSLLWTLIHAPQAIFDWHLSMGALSSYLLLVFIFGFGAAFVFGRSRNIVSAILLHVMWAWPIILFR